MPEEDQYTSDEQRELKIKTEKEEVKIPSTQFYENTLNFVRDSSQIQSLKSRSICLFKFLFRVTPIISFIITSSSLLLFTETPHDHFNCKKEN